MDTFIVPAVVLTLIGAVLTVGFARDYWFGRASEAWAVAEGRIVGWGGHAGTMRLGDSVAALTYEYAVNGTLYRSNRYDYAGRSGPREAGDILLAFPLGSRVVVHYDPGKPGRAVLATGATHGNVRRLILGGAFLVAGVATLFA